MQIHLSMNVDISRRGLYVRFGEYHEKMLGRTAIGFVVKPAGHMWFSERYGGWHGLQIGPLYVRTYRRREMNWPVMGEPK
jgi:hypothetical protein